MNHRRRLREIERVIAPEHTPASISFDLARLTTDERREIGSLGDRVKRDPLSLSPEERERARVLRDRIVIREERSKHA